MPLSDQQVRQYLDEGHLVVRGLLEPRSLLPLIHDLDHRVTDIATQLQAQGRLTRLHLDAPFEERLLGLYQAASDDEARHMLWHAVEVKYYEFESEALFDVMTHPALLDTVEQLVGPEIRFHAQSNLRAKLAGNRESIVPWHQDSVGLDPDSEDTLMVNFWIPLVNVTMDMGGMQVMRGNHHRGGELSRIFAIPDEQLPGGEIVDCPLALGDVLMIQKRTIHRSLPNMSDKVRWSLDFRYCDADLPPGRDGGFIARSKSQPRRAVTSLARYSQLLPNLRAVGVG